MKRRKTFKKRAWTDSEIRLLVEWFPKVGAKGCMPILPSRSMYQIKGKASEMGVEERDGFPWPDDRMASTWRAWRGPVECGALVPRIAA